MKAAGSSSRPLSRALEGKSAGGAHPRVEAGVLWRRLAYWGSRYGPLPWARHSPPILGVLFAALRPELRCLVRKNLHRALGRRPWVAEQVDTYRTFARYAQCLSESLAGERTEAREARRRIVGEHHLRSALGVGRGLIVVTAHLGAWEVAARLLHADWKIPVMLVMEREADHRAARLHDQVRSRNGVAVAYIEQALDSLELLRHLRRGGVVAIQLDRLPRGARYVEATLFGEPFRVPEGPFRLASIAGAPLLSVFTRRLGFLDYELRVTEALSLPRYPEPSALRAAVQSTLGELEKHVRECPTQWFHFESNPEPLIQRPIR